MNFNSRFFKEGFKKTNFKNFDFKKDIFNIKGSSYYNTLIMNKFQTMNYLSIINSCKMTNAMFLLNNINLTANNFTSEVSENDTTGNNIIT